MLARSIAIRSDTVHTIKTLKNESFNDLFYWYFSWYLSWYPLIYSNGLFYCQFTFSLFLGVTETSNHDNRAAIAFLI